MFNTLSPAIFVKLIQMKISGMKQNIDDEVEEKKSRKREQFYCGAVIQTNKNGILLAVDSDYSPCIYKLTHLCTIFSASSSRFRLCFFV